MPTLLIQLVGPMQSWGTSSQFSQRDTGKSPSKSAVLGLLAAASGIDRENWADLEPLTHLKMGVRFDRPGVLKSDYQTAGCARSDSIIKANGSQERGGGVVSHRQYLADAAFLVGLEGTDRDLLERLQAALHDPVWPLALGRKSYVSSEPIGLRDGVTDKPLLETLRQHPWIGGRGAAKPAPGALQVSLESADSEGTLVMDQLLSSFAERRFGARYVRSEWIEIETPEAAHAAA
jgi:CRISPR system Cascade subunit CasD